MCKVSQNNHMNLKGQIQSFSESGHTFNAEFSFSLYLKWNVQLQRILLLDSMEGYFYKFNHELIYREVKEGNVT